MSTTVSAEKKRFYLMSTDILQGISIFIVVLGHTALWWDESLDVKYPNLPFIPLLFLRIAFLVVPGFLFWYTMNTTNSLLRRTTEQERKKARKRLIKRTIIFFMFASSFEIISAIVSNPSKIINALFNWQLFHMFSFSTIFALAAIETSWYLNRKKDWNYKKILVIIYMATLLIVVMLFLIFHNYNATNRIPLYVELDLKAILIRTFIDYGQSPIIPYLSFSAAGGLTAAFLDLPNEKKETVIKRVRILIGSGVIFILAGIPLLSIEEYTSTPTGYPSSSPFVILSIGIQILLTTLLMLKIDLDKYYSKRSMNKLVLPIVIYSKITLTIFIVHNIMFIIPNDLPIITMLITDIHVAMIFGAIYAFFFVILALIWQKWRFKYSFEWTLAYLQNKSWG